MAVVFISGGERGYGTTAHAAPNYQINYQGKLTDDTGATVADGTYHIAFNLYDSGDSIVWSSTTTVPVTSGLFSYLLGSSTPLTAVDFNQTLSLSVNIGGTGAPTWDGEMTPRKVLGAVPAAFEATQLAGLATTSFLRSDQADSASGYLTFLGGASTTDLIVSGTATTTNLIINGALYDNNTSAGLSGHVLQSTASGLEWVATSTLGLAASTSVHDAVTLAGTPNYISLSGQQLTLSQLDLQDDLNTFTSANLANRLTDETGSGNLVFSASPVFSGLVGLGTSSPSADLTVYGDLFLEGASRYLNFGTATGSLGYGLRDNAGTIEFKNAGGTWQPATVATTGPSFFVHRNGSSTTTSDVAVQKVDFTIEDFDTNNNFDLTTDRFTPTIPGIYLFIANVGCTTSNDECQALVYKNGTAVVAGPYATAADTAGNAVTLTQMNGTTDYVDMRTFAGNGTVTINGTADYTHFSGTMIAPVSATGGGWDDNSSYVTLTDNTDFVGIGTSSPQATLDLWGGGTTDPFTISSSSGSRLLTIDATGKVGIGTTSPQTHLHIAGSSDELQLQVDYPGQAGLPAGALIRTRASSSLTLIADAAAGTAGKGVNISAYSGSAWFRGLNYSNRSGAPHLLLQQDGGNVGIGTSSPTEALYVDGVVAQQGNSDFRLKMIDSQTEDWALAINDDPTPANEFFGIYNIDDERYRLTIRDNDGFVGIGTNLASSPLDVYYDGQTLISVDASSGNSAGLQMQEGGSRRWVMYNQGNNDILYILDADSDTAVYLNQNDTAWNSGSDVRLKENIETLSVLDRLGKFRAVSFDWKQDGRPDLGVIAQELYEAFPEIVSKGSDAGDLASTTAEGMWGVQYAKIGPLALQGVKELDLKLEDLATSTLLDEIDEESFTSRFFAMLFERISAFLADSANGITSIITDTLTVREELCVDGVCVDGNDLRALLAVMASSTDPAGHASEEGDGGDAGENDANTDEDGMPAELGEVDDDAEAATSSEPADAESATSTAVEHVEGTSSSTLAEAEEPGAPVEPDEEAAAPPAELTPANDNEPIVESEEPVIEAEEQGMIEDVEGVPVDNGAEETATPALDGTPLAEAA